MGAIESVCASCGTRNRIPPKHLADSGRCGSCKSTLAPSSQPIEVDEILFDAITSEAKVPVLVDFWAEWCGPCRMSAPELQKLAREMSGRAVVIKVDIDAHPSLATRHGVQSIPNFLVFKDGRVVARHVGAAPMMQMRRWIEDFAVPNPRT
jgi:thioredoxin 2